MGKTLSLYLDALRFAAAFVVFLSHYSTHGFSGGLFWQIEPYGRTAVLVFFVLSGTIIAYVSEKREASLGEYAVSRIARIYSVVLPALAVTALLDAIIPSAAPELNGSTLGFASSVLFLGASWNLTMHPGSDLPFWSLNYEVWYYVLFGAATFLRSHTRALTLLVSALLAGPKVLLLFPVWLMGVAAWRWRMRIPERIGPLLIFFAMVSFFALELMGGQKAFWRANTPWLTDQYSLYDYIFGVIVAVFILGLSRSRLPELGPRLAGAVTWLAGASFGLYLLHYPLLRFFAELLGEPRDGFSSRIVLFVLSLGCSIALARAFEQSKAVYRTILKSGLHRFRTGSPEADIRAESG